MLYAFIGERAYEHAKIFFAKKVPHAVAERLLVDASSSEKVTDHLGASLFGGERVVFLEGFFTTAASRESLEGLLPTLVASPEHFAIIEVSLLAPQKKKLAAHTVHISEESKEKSEKPLESFALADCFARHDKSRAWVTYRKLLAQGESAEALHGIIFWKVKDLVTKGAHDSKRDLKKTLLTLAELPLLAREKGSDVEHALERFILEG